MEQREPGWYDDPWQEGLQRRWDGSRWTAEVRDPAAPGADTPPVAQPYEVGGDVPPVGPAVSDAERAVAAHEGRPAGHPTFAGMPWGRYDDDPRAMRTTRGLIRALWWLLIAFGVVLILWVIF